LKNDSQSIHSNMSRPYQQKRSLLEEHLWRDCAWLVEQYLTDHEKSLLQMELRWLVNADLKAWRSTPDCYTVLTVKRRIHLIDKCKNKRLNPCDMCEGSHFCCRCDYDWDNRRYDRLWSAANDAFCVVLTFLISYLFLRMFWELLLYSLQLR
jgi:hypothetical protein